MIISDSFSKASEHMHERKNGQYKAGSEYYLCSQASLAEFSKPLPAELFRKESSRGSYSVQQIPYGKQLKHSSFVLPSPIPQCETASNLKNKQKYFFFALCCGILGLFLCAPTSLRLMFFRGEVCIVKAGKVRSRQEKKKTMTDTFS